ncbi:MAG: threonylcarbamoyl-AMP synthase [Planctomycetota bacterium]|nr:MAG: threonylcarbamoyl-AMP synthase [Planctomycetota bacterium]
MREFCSLPQAVAALKRGELVAIPTETVYGLGGVALWPGTVARIFEVKGRPTFDPLIVHVPTLDAVDEIVSSFPPAARSLATHFWPGPLTLVLPKAAQIPDLVTAGLPSVAVRIPAHPFARELLERLALPVAAPSANLFGRVSPTTAAHVADQLGDQLDWILDGGPCSVGVESTVVSFAEAGVPCLLRPGGISLEALEAVIGPVNWPQPITSEHPAVAQLAPGTLPQHYAPLTTISLGDLSQTIPPGKIGALAFQSCPRPERFAVVEILSPLGDLAEAAAQLFAAMRRLDCAGLDAIIAERVPDYGLGRAINDRLTRAAWNR